MVTNKILVGAMVGTIGIVGVAAALMDTQAGITLDTETAKHVVWNKPTTDAGWAEDVKAESFDIKSTDVLKEMIAAHTEKLAQEQKDFQEYQDCPQCIVYDKKKQLQDNNFTDPKITIDQEAQNEATTDTDQRQWQIEKIEQSIERMNHELDLRARAVVVPDKLNREGTPATKSALQKVAPEMVRHIND